MNKKVFFSIIVLLIIFIMLYGVFSLTEKAEINLQDKSKDIVYDKFINNKKTPYVNLVGGDIDKINANIELFVRDYVNDEYSDISYDYNKKGNILSLIIRIIDSKSIDVSEVKFTSYNILLNNSKLISDDELFTLLDSNKTEVEKVIENSFIDYYNNSEIRKSIDYDTYKNYQSKYFDYNKDVSYYINKNIIYGYINMNSGIDYTEYNYFLNKDFKVSVGDINA